MVVVFYGTAKGTHTVTRQIVADENIPFVREAFATLGEVTTMSGRAMTAEAVRDAEVLAVRSITPVNAGLLEGSRVRFVGTATIGVDHIDRQHLKRNDIAFASAPGSNATSVAEYIVAALLVLARRDGFLLKDKSIGVVGVGNVGRRVAARAEALGMTVVLNDPPLRRKTGDDKYRPLEEALACDIVTLHVPLTREGDDPTHHLFDETTLHRMQPGAILLNTSRGAVVDNGALLQELFDGHLRAAVLDVWEGEPDIRFDLLAHVALGTPHIAGYSFDGKVKGLDMIYRAACKALGEKPTWKPQSVLPPVADATIDLSAYAADDDAAVQSAIERAVLHAYPIERDDDALRSLRELAPDMRAKGFDRLRKEYPVRREFGNFVVTGAPGAEVLQGLGFGDVRETENK